MSGGVHFPLDPVPGASQDLLHDAIHLAAEDSRFFQEPCFDGVRVGLVRSVNLALSADRLGWSGVGVGVEV